MSAFWANLAAHLTAYGFGSGFLIVAFVSAFPKLIPKRAQDWWDWVRAAIQMALPIKQDVSKIEQTAPRDEASNPEQRH